MTAENIAALDQAMDDAGVRHTTELYEGAQHGYTMSDMAVSTRRHVVNGASGRWAHCWTARWRARRRVSENCRR